MIFRAMERQLDPQSAKGVDAVVHWKIGGRDGRALDRWQVVIRDGRCRASTKLDEAPRVTIKVGRLRFLELVTGIASGPALFMSGKVKLEGDMMLAARLPMLFRVPRPGARERSRTSRT